MRNSKFIIRNSYGKGFTLIEVIIVVAILVVLMSVSVASWVLIQQKSNIDSASDEFAGVVKLAQNETVNSKQDAEFGVYVDAQSAPHKYILFRGASYAARQASFDRTYILPKIVEFFAVNLGGGNEVVFKKVTGATDQPGSVSLRLKADASQNKTVYMSNNGVIGFDAPVSIQDTSLKDSRHVTFDYNRSINTGSENIILNFENDAAITTIPIMLFLDSAGQIFWEGEVLVAGQSQAIKIHTTRLNSPNTQFSVHRDGRYNTKSLKISISGDASGTIAEYSANGLTTSFSSIYVTNFAWE